ncbi:MAG: hypothetical protein KBT28_01590 [Bacteroidales bacterium]|nr:hypothetical protein [Candidatus Colimorpha merdihippi]
MPIAIPGAIKRNVYLFKDNHTEKRDSHLPDIGWVHDEITDERDERIAADKQLQANIDDERERAMRAEDVLQANIDAEQARAEKAEETLQANIDAERERAEAVEDTKENLSNKIAATGTYVKDDTHYPTTALMEAKIAELSPKEVEWATYGSTKLYELCEWDKDEKTVLCKYNDYIYRMASCSTNTAVFATTVPHGGITGTTPNGIAVRELYVTSTGWSTLATVEVELINRKLASTATWSSGDTKYPTTAATDARYEQKSNKLAEGDTYVKDDTHYPTTALMEAKIAELSPEEVEWATYDDTDFWTIEEWMDDGKVVLCNYEDHVYVATWKDSQTVNFSSSIVSQNICDMYYLSCNSRFGWENGVCNTEIVLNKQTTESDWFSSDELYPSTSAVDARIAELAPNEIEWAIHDVTTYDQIKAWSDAGKVVLCKYTTGRPHDYIMELTTITSEAAFFCGVQGTSEHIFEVGTNNKWKYSNQELQASSIIRSYETWHDTDDTHYPTLAAVSQYVAEHSGGVQIFEHGGQESLPEILEAHEAGKVVLCYNSANDVYMQLYRISEWIASFIGIDEYGWMYVTDAMGKKEPWTEIRVQRILNETMITKSTDGWPIVDTEFPSNAAVTFLTAMYKFKTPATQGIRLVRNTDGVWVTDKDYYIDIYYDYGTGDGQKLPPPAGGVFSVNSNSWSKASDRTVKATYQQVMEATYTQSGQYRITIPVNYCYSNGETDPDACLSLSYGRGNVVHDRLVIPVVYDASMNEIVAEGDTNGWHWRKWANGWAEMTAIADKAVVAFTAWGTMWEGVIFDQKNLPFSLTSLPHVTVRCSHAGLIEFSQTSSKSVCPTTYLVRPLSTSTLNNITTSVKVEGWWK